MAGCAVCLHKNVHPNVCSDCLGGTHFKPRIKTNADRIRSMSDEELAEFLELDRDCYGCILKCQGHDGKPLSREACKLKVLDWLKEEGGRLKICETCSWYDYWFGDCIRPPRVPVDKDSFCDQWESFEEQEEDEEEE